MQEQVTAKEENHIYWMWVFTVVMMMVTGASAYILGLKDGIIKTEKTSIYQHYRTIPLPPLHTTPKDPPPPEKTPGN